MDLKTAVIIATKGRPQEVSNLLATLALQTVAPDLVVVSACDSSDIASNAILAKNVEVIFGPPGLPAQRNRALTLALQKCDIVVFFDDDFIPSRYWLEHLQKLLATQSAVLGVTGQVIADGVRSGGLEWSEGQSIVNDADSFEKQHFTLNNRKMRNTLTIYGCNMAFRAESIRHLTFDERLILYGWLEDRDFASRASTEGRMIHTDAVWGVHLGINRARVSGLRFGYSQVVNPWYLLKKGTMTPLATGHHILRGFAANTFGLFFQNNHVDRWGRLKGNLVGVKDIMVGRWAPERIADL
jgi:GT2 family glycosyltransferase